jgi:hypothetical protein
MNALAVPVTLPKAEPLHPEGRTLMSNGDLTPGDSGEAHLLRLRTSFEAKHERSPAIRNLQAAQLEDQVYSDFMELLFLGSRRQKEVLLEYSERDPKLLEQIMSLPPS